jgi:hypothetical protein
VSASRPVPPDEIVLLARQRTGARATRDWARADALRAEIETAGWRVVDKGTAFVLEPAAPPTVDDGGVVRYGASADVPSRLGQPADATLTVVFVAHDRPLELGRALASVRTHAPAGTEVVIVANDPTDDLAVRLAPDSLDLAPIAGAAPEVTWTSSRLGVATAFNMGLRRARGAVVVLADPAIELRGDAFTPVQRALDDPGVAVAGAFGLASADLRRFDASPGPVVDVLELGWLACRRTDASMLGPLDEKFADDAFLGAWWSLVLRAGRNDGAEPRQAIALDLPIVRSSDGRDRPDPAHDRQAKRNWYRLLEGFRGRPDLLSGQPLAAPAAGEGSGAP